MSAKALWANIVILHMAASALTGYTAHIIHESAKYGPAVAQPVWVIWYVLTAMMVVTAIAGMINFSRRRKRG